MPELSPSPTEIFSDAGAGRRRPAGIGRGHRRRHGAGRSARPSAAAAARARACCFWLAFGWIVVLTFCAIFADYLPFVRSYSKIYPAFKQPPSTEHWFGTDKIGHDIFARCIYGARLSLAIAGSSIVLGLLFGGIFGLIAGYYRRKADTRHLDRRRHHARLPGRSSWLCRSPAFLGASARERDPGPGHPVDPAAHPHRAGQHARVRPARVRAGGPQPRRQEPPHPVPRDPAQHRAGHAHVRPHAAWPCSSSPKGRSPSSARACRRPSRRGASSIADGQQDLATAWWISLMPAAMMFVTILAFNILGDVLAKRFDIREGVAVTSDRLTALPAARVRRRCSRSRDLRTHFLTAARHGAGRRRREPHARAGQDARRRRRVRLGQDHPVPLDHGPAAQAQRRARGHASSSRASRSPRCRSEERRRIWGREMAMIFQDPMTSLNPVMKIGRQITESLTRAPRHVASATPRPPPSGC